MSEIAIRNSDLMISNRCIRNAYATLNFMIYDGSRTTWSLILELLPLIRQVVRVMVGKRT